MGLILIEITQFLKLYEEKRVEFLIRRHLMLTVSWQRHFLADSSTLQFKLPLDHTGPRDQRKNSITSKNLMFLDCSPQMSCCSQIPPNGRNTAQQQCLNEVEALESISELRYQPLLSPLKSQPLLRSQRTLHSLFLARFKLSSYHEHSLPVVRNDERGRGEESSGPFARSPVAGA